MDAWVSLKMGHSMSFQWGRWWHSSLSDKPIYCTQYKKKKTYWYYQPTVIYFHCCQYFCWPCFLSLGASTGRAPVSVGNPSPGWERERLIARSLLSRGDADGIIWDQMGSSLMQLVIFFSCLFWMLLIGLIGVLYFQLRFWVLRL